MHFQAQSELTHKNVNLNNKREEQISSPVRETFVWWNVVEHGPESGSGASYGRRPDRDRVTGNEGRLRLR